MYHFHPYLIPLIFSFIILLCLAIYGFQNRSVRGAMAFAFSMLIGAIWAGGNMLEMAATDLSPKLFWANLQYLAYTLAPVSWLVMVLYFTEKTHLINKRNLIFVSIIPIITNILVWTNGWHQLMRANIYLDTSGYFPVIAKDYGLWFWVHSLYCYLLNFFSMYFLLKILNSKNKIYRIQTIFLTTGWFLVFLYNILYIFKLSPITRFDLTPIVFTIAGIIIAWGIFRFKLFKLMPVARQTIIEKMDTGIIVVDSSLRIIDINPEAQKLIGIGKDYVIGSLFSSIYSEFDKLIIQDGILNTTREEISLTINGTIRNFELHISPINDYRNDLVAWVVIINDITELKMVREQMYKQQKELAVMNEREWIARELHDNLSQVIQYIKTQTATVKKYMDKDAWEEASCHVNRLYEVVQQTNTDIRNSITKLKDKKKEWDFNQELKDFLKKLCRANGYLIEQKNFNRNTFVKMPTFKGYQLFSIIQEALNNAVQHGQSDNITLKLKLEEDTLQAIIKDDGCGFDLENISEKNGYGLDTMLERARACQGSLQIDSRPRQGTVVRAKIPGIKGERGSMVVELEKQGGKKI